MEKTKIDNLLVGGEPVYVDNPHGWTQEDILSLYKSEFRDRAMAFSIKLMGIQQRMRQGGPEIETP